MIHDTHFINGTEFRESYTISGSCSCLVQDLAWLSSLRSGFRPGIHDPHLHGVEHFHKKSAGFRTRLIQVPITVLPPAGGKSSTSANAANSVMSGVTKILRLGKA